MQGRRSLNNSLHPFVDRVDRVRRTMSHTENNDEFPVNGPANQDQGNQGNENRQEAAPERRMREYAMPQIQSASSPIVLGQAVRNYELKVWHFNQLPSFHGMANEDPLDFIRDFLGVVQIFALGGLNEDQLRMKCFPYTMKDKAKQWLNALIPGSLTSWTQIYEKFIGRFFPHEKTTKLRRQISTFDQENGESFYEAWERYKLLQCNCPHHGYPPSVLNQTFYDGLTQTCQNYVDNAAGGCFMEKTPEEVYDLYEMLGANSQQKSVRGKKVQINEVRGGTQSDALLMELTNQVKLLSKKVDKFEERCESCGDIGHGAVMCPKVYGDYADESEQVNWAMGQSAGRPEWEEKDNNYNRNAIQPNRVSLTCVQSEAKTPISFNLLKLRFSLINLVYNL